MNETVLNEKLDKNGNMINEDIGRIKKLQVELDNITASDLVGRDRLSGIISNVDSIFKRSEIANIDSISNLRPDAVMRLIK